MLSRRSLLLGAALGPRPRALIVDGRNNHDWRASTPILRRILERWFDAAVATAPNGKGPAEGFVPDFAAHSVVVLNYSDLGNGGSWPKTTQQMFERYVTGGGGVVVFHAASSAFAEWPEYNRIIGLGGWGGRDERSGPMVRYRNGLEVRDTRPGKAGRHGKRHEFAVTIRDAAHPIVSGFPPVWMHTVDELYDSMRGPAEAITVLATAWSDPATGGTGEHEPVLMTVRRGKGRIFHTALGHDEVAMDCTGFAMTLARGTEWAATGKVTIPLPARFPTATQSVRYF
jgi:uncharacterized protein